LSIGGRGPVEVNERGLDGRRDSTADVKCAAIDGLAEGPWVEEGNPRLKQFASIIRAAAALNRNIKTSVYRSKARCADGANLYATVKTLGFDIDYKRLLEESESRGTLLRSFYYIAIVEDQENTSIRPLIDWLDYNGYTVVTKANKQFIDASGRRKLKGNMLRPWRKPCARLTGAGCQKIAACAALARNNS
jgi:hypothetical protein